MPEFRILTVDVPIRLDLFLAEEWGHLGRAQIQHMIDGGHILVDDIKARKVAQILQSGNLVKVALPIPENPQTDSEPLPHAVLFENENLIVIDKPAGLSMKSMSRTQQPSLASSLVSSRPAIANIGGVGRAGILTTLGEAVSGLVLLAKHDLAYREMRRSLKRQRVTYTFTAMVEGHMRGEGVIEEPIGNARHERERLQVSREGRTAVTAFRVQRRFRENDQEYTLLIIKPETSHRHQIRVHLSWYGFPLVGDKLYGLRHQTLLFDRLFLHLGVLEFPDPLTGELVHVESALPLELQSIITYFLRS